MAIRDDIVIRWYEDPRIADFTSATAEINVQDSHDTLATIEDTVEGEQFPGLVSTAGKEDLGGGTQVGLTSTLQNLQYAPPATSPRKTGTTTATDATGVTLTDSGADFVADGVQRGDWVINFTDQSVTEVLSVTTTALTTRGLRDGTANTFTSGDAYKVWEVAEFQLSGGNFVAIDDVEAPLNPLFTTFGIFATRTSSSSATLQELQDIQFASFNGGVWVDLVNGTPGITFPTGTERQPCDNFTDALSIAATRGFLSFFVIGDATIDASNDYTGYRFFGSGQNLSTFTLAANGLFVDASFEDATITGTLDGDAHIDNCIVSSLTFVSGVIENCILEAGTITLGGSSTAHFINCASGVPGASTPIIDMGGSGQALALRNYNGGIEIRNKTGSDNVSIDLNSGHVILHSTVDISANDEIFVRGIGKLTDNSTGFAVDNELVSGVDVKEIHNRLGLELGDPLTDTTSGMTSNRITVDRTGDGETTSTLTRQ